MFKPSFSVCTFIYQWRLCQAGANRTNIPKWRLLLWKRQLVFRELCFFASVYICVNVLYGPRSAYIVLELLLQYEHKCCIDDACRIHRSSNSSGIIVHCIANDCELNADHETSTTVTHRSSLCHSTSHKAHRLVVNRSVSKSVYTCTTGWTKRFEYSSAYNK